MHHIFLWKWSQPGFRERYLAEHVNVMCSMLRRNLTIPHRIVLITDDPEGVTACDTAALWPDHSRLPNVSGGHLPSCYRRLRLFNPETLYELGVEHGDRVVSLDLDTVVINNLDDVLSREERFVGWTVEGTHHKKVLNGSMFMFTAGDLADVWSEFDPSKSPLLAHGSGFLGSDQGWMSYKLVRQAWCGGWTNPDVVSYAREVRVSRALRRENKIVMFHGKRKPWAGATQRESPWIRRYWRL